MAAGIFSTVPTSGHSALNSGQWTLGPNIILGKLTKKSVIGIFANHQWSVAGWSGPNVNLSSMQLFATFLPGGGWNVGSSPFLTYDWNSSQWTIPINLTVGKTVIMGGKPWKISAEVNYYVEKADSFGPEWMVGINLAPVVKNIFAK